MLVTAANPQVIEAILFDMNSTLRACEPHMPTQTGSRERILELLGNKEANQAFWEGLEQRYQAYNRWGRTSLVQCSESEIWTKWMLPDYPAEKIEPLAAELMLAWTQRRGRLQPMPGVEEALCVLKQRGYHLGVISNSMSSLDIPRFLERYGWNEYFGAVILSAVIKIRKPDPEPFFAAARALNVEPAHCAYLGNRIMKDISGCKRAGYGLAIMIVAPSRQPEEQENTSIEPDLVIQTVGELLDIFPGRHGKG
jgi:putative hydrolase of the HAD superfamily